MNIASKSSSVVFRSCSHPGNKNKKDTGFENLTKYASVRVGQAMSSVDKAQSIKDLGYMAGRTGSAAAYSVSINMLSEFLESFKTRQVSAIAPTWNGPVWSFVKTTAGT